MPIDGLMSKERPTILEPAAGDPYRYRVRYFDHVGRQRQRTFRGVDERGARSAKRDAQAFVDELIGKSQRGLRTHSSRMLVEDLFDEWWEHYVDSPTIAPGTANGSYGPACEHRILPYMGQAEIGSVDRKTVQAFVAWMSRQGVGPQTIANTLAALSSMFARAIEWDYVAVNPVHGVKRPKVADPERRAYEPHEVYALAAGMRFDRDRAMVVFAAFSGLRKGDVYSLEWRNIDTGPLELPDDYEPSMRVWRQKSQAWTDVPLLEPARLALLWWRAVTPYPDGLVFTSSKGTSLAKQASAWYRRCWRPGCAAAGMLRCANARCGAAVPATEDAARRIAVDPKRGAENLAAWRAKVARGERPRGPEPIEPWACEKCGEHDVVGPVFHELRHSFASIAVAATGDASQVAEWGGWSGTQMLERRYKKQLQRGRRRAVAMVNELVADWSS